MNELEQDCNRSVRKKNLFFFFFFFFPKGDKIQSDDILTSTLYMISTPTATTEEKL